ncbi:MAG TPA: glucose-1-phosphate adenylyltransferase, partial [Opitutae bacterium]|nr:glucose-1-phosphate adenylyltransferase [Opitutae bacterium]
NARIGRNVILSPKGLSDGWADEGQNVYVRDGIVVVVKNALVEDGTKIGHS